MCSPAGPTTGLRLLLLVLPVASGACTTFGATLPPGSAVGSFLDEAHGTVPMSAIARAHQGALDAAERAHVQANVEIFRGLREDARRLRVDLRRGAADLVTDDGRDFINKSDLRRVRDLARRYLELDALLYALWATYRNHLPYRSEPDPYAPMRAATLLSPATRELGGLLALAAELERLDTASVVVETLRPHHALTRFLNRGDAQLELAPESFDRCIGALYDPDHRTLVEQQLRAWQRERERILARAAADEHAAVLLESIEQSGAGRAVLGEGGGPRRLAFLWTVLERSSLNALGPLFDAVIAGGFIELRDDEAAMPTDTTQAEAAQEATAQADAAQADADPAATPSAPAPEAAASEGDGAASSIPGPADELP